MKTLIIFLCLFWIDLIPVLAQDNWNLEKCILYALENNIQIKQEMLNAEYNQNNYNQSKFDVLPSLQANADQGYVFGRSVNPYTNEITTNNYQSTNFSLGSSVVLFNGLQKYNSIKQNEFNMLASLQDVEKVKNDVSLNIAMAYLQILFDKEQLTISENQLLVTNQQIERTRKMVDAGSMAKGSLLEIQAQAANEDLQVIMNKNKLESSVLSLKQMLDLDASIKFNIVIPEMSSLQIIPLNDSIEAIYQTALAMPQIKSAEYMVKSNEKQLAVAKGAYSPQLALYANYATGYSNLRKQMVAGDPQLTQIGFVENTNENVMALMPTYNETNYAFGDQFKDNAAKYLTLQLTIPIFTKFQTKKNISNSKIAVKNSEFGLQLAKNQLYKDIQQAVSEANAAFAKYNGSQKAVDAMSESFKYTQQKFDLGLINSVDYNLAKNNYTKAESDFLRSKYEYIFRIKILDFYKGNPIKI